MVGLWLLVPEHLRLGTWDLLCGWTGHPTPRLEPRVSLQLIHEAALCVIGVRQQRSLSQKGFELLNGLPFVVSDMAVHQLLGAHTVDEAQQLQVALGLLRRASGHFCGHLLAIDPHRVRSYSKRQMRRHRKENGAKPTKVAQTFFVLDADTHQPVCFTTGTSSRTDGFHRARQRRRVPSAATPQGLPRLAGRSPQYRARPTARPRHWRSNSDRGGCRTSLPPSPIGVSDAGWEPR